MKYSLQSYGLLSVTCRMRSRSLCVGLSAQRPDRAVNSTSGRTSSPGDNASVQFALYADQSPRQWRQVPCKSSLGRHRESLMMININSTDLVQCNLANGGIASRLYTLNWRFDCSLQLHVLAGGTFSRGPFGEKNVDFLNGQYVRLNVSET